MGLRLPTVCLAGLLFPCIATSALFGAGVATPSTAPSTRPATGMQLWFEQLADLDPDVREQARVNLMGLSRRELPELADIVKKNRPLRPSQISQLHDIVTHIYLSGEPYPRVESESGFLGLHWPNGQEAWSNPNGLVVDLRIKGFCAYRYLREGDVILGIRELPDTEFVDSRDLSSALLRFRAGDSVTMIILRAGRVVPIKLKLDARPDWPVGVVIDGIQAPREKNAEAYWDSAFANLVGESVSSAGK